MCNSKSADHAIGSYWSYHRGVCSSILKFLKGLDHVRRYNTLSQVETPCSERSSIPIQSKDSRWFPETKSVQGEVFQISEEKVFEASKDI